MSSGPSTRPGLAAAALLVSTCILLCSGPAFAAPEVDCQIRAIHATRAGEVDPRLEPIAGNLRSAFAGYRGFKLLSSHSHSLKKGQSGESKLPTGHSLRVTFLEMAGEFIRMVVSIPPRLRTTVRVKDGGTFFQAGLVYKGGILILAITPSVG